MRNTGEKLLTGALRLVAVAILSALLVYAGGCAQGVEPAPTPVMTGSASASRTPQPSAAAEASPAPDEGAIYLNGVWVATVLSIDFPSQTGDAEAQKTEFLEILDNTKSWGLDTVFVQVRPMGDALYESELNPWSSFLTGVQGKDPEWDPLSYMIEEAHDRGISFHAWLNPYRVLHPGSGLTTADLSGENIAVRHPEWLIMHEGYVYLDPAREEVKQHIAATVKEIVDNYDVDGIHFDDYFYPADYPLPEGAERDGFLDMERRTQVNDMLRRVRNVCLEADHPVMFGVSPFGVWKNSTSDPAGSDTQANESYYSMAADSVRWIREDLIDYIAPQLYWPVGHKSADYRILAEWWADQTQGTGVSLLIGQGIYSEEVAADIENELEVNASIPQITGSIFFSYSDLVSNKYVADVVTAFCKVSNASNAMKPSEEQPAGTGTD